MDEPGNLLSVYLKGRGLYGGTHKVRGTCHDTLPLANNLHFISQLYLWSNRFVFFAHYVPEGDGGLLQ